MSTPNLDDVFFKASKKRPNWELSSLTWIGNRPGGVWEVGPETEGTRTWGAVTVVAEDPMPGLFIILATDAARLRAARWNFEIFYSFEGKSIIFEFKKYIYRDF